MTTTATALGDTIRSALPRLEAISETVAARPRALGKWSRKEILGHLIDSASINHERFVRAQRTDDLVCPPYDQDSWVELQGYRDSRWTDLVSLWQLFNLHLAHVMRSCSADARTRPRMRHNLYQVAFRAVPADQSTTLEYFMNDYVQHLGHHLEQILGRNGAE